MKDFTSGDASRKKDTLSSHKDQIMFQAINDEHKHLYHGTPEDFAKHVTGQFMPEELPDQLPRQHRQQLLVLRGVLFL